MSDLYDTDIVVWSERQAALLRRMAAGERVNDQVDWENVAGEIEALGISDRREVRTRVRTILAHLLKLHLSPATEPRPGWRETVREQRRQLRTLLDESPSLRPTLPAVLGSELPEARLQVIASLADRNEHPRVDPAGLTYTDDPGAWSVAARWSGLIRYTYAPNSAVCACAASSAGKRSGSPRAMPHSVATPSTRTWRRAAARRAALPAMSSRCTRPR